MWDKATSWFKRESGQARETAPAEKKEAKP